MYCQTRRTIGGRSVFLINHRTTKFRHHGDSMDFKKTMRRDDDDHQEIEYYEANKPIQEKQTMDSLITKLGKVELTRSKRKTKNVSFKP